MADAAAACLLGLLVSTIKNTSTQSPNVPLTLYPEISVRRNGIKQTSVDISEVMLRYDVEL